jgi:4'-phosphopantetheinyl transferase
LVCGTEVGLDLEIVDARRDAGQLLKIARRFFAQDEIRYLVERVGSTDFKRDFYRVWTRKEAYVKYLGRGIGHGLSTFSVVTGVHGVYVDTLEPIEGFMLSYCHGEARASGVPVIKELKVDRLLVD